MSIRKGNDIIASTPAVDTVPQQDSVNVITSGGVYTALQGKQNTLTAGTNIQITGSTISATDTTYNNFTGATAGDAGANGLVPAPAAGDQGKFLQGDGTWAMPTAATAWGNITGTLSNQTDLQNALDEKSSYHPDLFDWKWADHELNDMQWLRADTFSWQDGTVYSSAYNHLVDEYNALVQDVWFVIILNVGYWYRNTSLDAAGASHPYAFSNEFGENVAYCDYEQPSVGTALYNGSGSSATSLGNITGGCYEDTIRWASKETVGGVTISFYLADDGHKICPDTQESNVASIYSATGVAWYYILDTVNERFKLPRTKFGVTGYRDGVGNYVAPGLPDISGSITPGYGTWRTLTVTGAFTKTGTIGTQAQGESGSSTGTIKFNASNSNAIYGNSNTVQPPATQMYLYFYVGEFTQTALENTAGLNAELFNDKVDLDGSNATFSHVIQTYTNGTEWYRLYSDGWCEQGGLATVGTGGTGTVNFLKPFTNTNYDFQCDIGRRADSSTWVVYPTPTYTTTSQGLKSNLTGYTLYTRWYACGYVS